MIIEDSKARKTPLHMEHNEMAGDGINVDLSTYMYVQVAGDRSRARVDALVVRQINSVLRRLRQAARRQAGMAAPLISSRRTRSPTLTHSLTYSLHRPPSRRRRLLPPSSVPAFATLTL